MAHEVSIQEAEAIRDMLGLDRYRFSVKIGLQPTSYHQAIKRRKISRYMAFRIAMHYPAQLKKVRQ